MLSEPPLPVPSMSRGVITLYFIRLDPKIERGLFRVFLGCGLLCIIGGGGLVLVMPGKGEPMGRVTG